ncbi:MAG: hypothetical protein R3279_02220 [Putridiphycobacter sp.]|jgi:hypothetical protein|nr:hypothetical protein [Putridiphycobacter sp.]
MTENNQVIEPWNDESNMSMDERRGKFLQVLCILSWIYIAIQLFSSVVAYIGGPEKLMQAKSEAEDAIAAVDDSGFMKTVMAEAMIVLDKTIENFNAIHIGNILGLLIGGLAVYMMFTLKKTGFFLYILYVVIIAGVSVYFLGFASAIMDILVSIAFIIMYGVNVKRMTA